ncbi:MAG: hypothetical protein M3440_14825 [Chloroflexota bacterium]|nr:hypothetical protein [Chloroflexota bacterium]
MNAYPIYIVSKGRYQHERRLTNRALVEMGVPHFIVVEEQEADFYRAVVDPRFCMVLVLDPSYQRDYETCDDLGDSKSKGPGPARNFAWDHAKGSGHAWHWVMDDNIKEFFRMNHNKRIRVTAGSCFVVMEDFVGRYTNIAMSGPVYRQFIDPRTAGPPFITNTRIYSCNLIRNDVPFRWRGRYNEDTILSLDMLKDGWCTVQFYVFLQRKTETQRIKGGNTDEFYAKEGTRAKSEMQVRVHPDVSRLVWKYGRWHHHVDYRPFKKNRLIRKPGLVIPEGVNNYGMKLVQLHDDTTHAKAAD